MSDELLPIAALAALLVAIMWGGIHFAQEEEKQWAAFASEHDCKVVGRMSATTNIGTGFGFAGNGQMGVVTTTSTTPSKTQYACNDGVTYWR